MKLESACVASENAAYYERADVGIRHAEDCES